VTESVSAPPARTPDPAARSFSVPARVAGVAVLVATALSLFQLWTAGIRPAGLFLQRGVHLGMVQVLAFLLFPWPGRGRGGWSGLKAWVVDGLLITGSVAAPAYLIGNLDAIVDRAGAWTTVDLTMGVVAVVTLLEASRRVLGWGITVIGLGAVGYGYLGPWLPGLLHHGGYSTGRIIGQLYLGQEGIFGIPLGVAATFVFVFILFGAFLEVTGAGRFFIDLAYALTGRQRGGPAKAAVLASASLGSVSGSAIANVVTSGAFTIPLMKRVGYRPEEAGGVEAAASTGGQVLPPIMGAGAFLIAEYTGLAYLEVVKAALLPALLYLATVFLFVHLVAARRDLEGLAPEALPVVSRVMAGGWHYLAAVVVLVWALILDVSVARVGFISCLAVVALAGGRAIWDRVRDSGAAAVQGAPEDRMADGAGLAEGDGEARSEGEGGPGGEVVRQSVGAWLLSGGSRMVDAFVRAGRNTLTVSLACAVAGIIVGIVGLTGLGLKFSSLMLAFSGGNLLLALLLLILASLVLGMGLPVTASYVVLIVLAGPALVTEFGLPILVAHLVVFWYSQDSNVTPPVCLAAFAAAGVAGAHPMRTGLHAWKYAKGLYLIPLYMVVHPEIVLGGPWAMVLFKGAVALAGLAAFAAALEGYLTRRLGWLARALLMGILGVSFHPSAWVAGVAPILLGAVLLTARVASRGGHRPGG
jgi:TRAP transporter 4TM/12TM fusion protein